MAEGSNTKSRASSRAELMVKTMVMKKLRNEGSIPDVAGLDDIEIPPEHEELLSGLTKLFKSADKNFLTLAELREFVRATNAWCLMYVARFVVPVLSTCSRSVVTSPSEVNLTFDPHCPC